MHNMLASALVTPTAYVMPVQLSANCAMWNTLVHTICASLVCVTTAFAEALEWWVAIKRRVACPQMDDGFIQVCVTVWVIPTMFPPVCAETWFAMMPTIAISPPERDAARDWLLRMVATEMEERQPDAIARNGRGHH